MRKNIFTRIILLAWLFIWVLFLVRPYFKKDLIGEYSMLLSLRSLDEKRAYATGGRLYEFIAFCNDSLRSPSTYRIIGLDKEDPISYRRAAYYLYPNIDKDKPKFLLVYNVKGFSEKGYEFFKSLDPDRYILKKADR